MRPALEHVRKPKLGEGRIFLDCELFLPAMFVLLVCRICMEKRTLARDSHLFHVSPLFDAVQTQEK
jgi:hypothetical protein